MITAVLMPTTSPCEETSGPPELPGLSAASVWITSSISRPERARSERPERRDDAGRHRRFEAERIADGDHELAALEQLGIAQRRRRQRHRRVDAHQREIGVGVVADDARGQAAALDGGDVDAGGAADHVAVGQHQPVGRHDDARAGAAMAPFVAGLDVEPHHGGADAVDHVDDGAGIGIEQRLVLGRDTGGVLARSEVGLVEHGWYLGARLAMAGMPVIVRKWLMDLGFARRYGVRHVAGEERGRRSQARDRRRQE